MKEEQLEKIALIASMALLLSLFVYALVVEIQYQMNPIKKWKIQVFKTEEWGAKIFIYSSTGKYKVFNKCDFNIEPGNCYIIHYLPNKKGERDYNQIVGVEKIY